MLLSGPPLFRLEPHLTDKLFNLEEIDAGKLHALVNRIKAHPASVKVILLRFSDRELLLLMTLDDHGLHAKEATPLCLRKMCRASATVCSLGLHASHAMRAALSFEISRPHRMSPGPLCAAASVVRL